MPCEGNDTDAELSHWRTCLIGCGATGQVYFIGRELRQERAEETDTVAVMAWKTQGVEMDPAAELSGVACLGGGLRVAVPLPSAVPVLPGQ